jgi:hypothetical protein
MDSVAGAEEVEMVVGESDLGGDDETRDTVTLISPD